MPDDDRDVARDVARDIKIAELAMQYSAAEQDLERLQKQLTEGTRYQNNMLEDLIGRMSRIENAATRFETNLHHVNGNGSSTNTRLTGIEVRLLAIERLAWVAAGGMTTITGLCVFFGWQALKILVRQ